MHDTKRPLSAIEYGDGQAAEQLLPLIYDELHRLAAELVARERPGQTLQATALVNEAYIRLVEPIADPELERSSPFLRRRGGGYAADPGRTCPAEACQLNLEEAGIVYRSTTSRSRTASTMASRLMTSSPSTRPSSGLRPKTRSRPSLSSSATSLALCQRSRRRAGDLPNYGRTLLALCPVWLYAELTRDDSAAGVTET